MTPEPTVAIRLDGEGTDYRPGETLSGQYVIKWLDSAPVTAVEVSVLWHTEGKGDEDMAVHEFWRRDADDSRPIDASQPERFRTTLPNCPLSYEGQIVKLRWVVRVRAFLQRGKEVVGERPFQLGNVPPVRTHGSAQSD
jgi:hypothetical protein